jgi:hypothetical protein
MANDGRCNCNNGDNNDVESPPSTLEQLLIVQAQLHRTVQQMLVQMQDINQLMQSMEARPSSRKRKSVAQDDVGQAQKINATENVAPNHQGGSMLAKATTTCFNCGQVGYFSNRCPDRHQCPTPTLHPNRSQVTMDANQVRGDRKCYNCRQKGHFAKSCTNPRTRPPLTLSSTSSPPSNPQAKEKEKVHPED